MIKEDLQLEIPHFGLSSYKIDNHNYKYNELEQYLKQLYTSYIQAEQTSDFLYKALLNIDFYTKTDWYANSETYIEKIKQFQMSQNKKWENIRINDDFYWTYFRFKDNTDAEYNNINNIKVYITFNSQTIKETFTASIFLLLEKGLNSFAAKISKFKRADQICYWINKNEYKLLQDFYKDFNSQLLTPMRFIAYDNKLGISHEININSHNCINSRIIDKYFKTITKIDVISLSDMYSQYASNWNNQSQHSTKRIESNFLDELVVIIATIELILGINVEQNKHFILSDAYKIWYTLASSRNWEDFKQNYTRI